MFAWEGASGKALKPRKSKESDRQHGIGVGFYHGGMVANDRGDFHTGDLIK